MCCTLLLTNSNCSIHSWIQNRMMISVPPAFDMHWFLGPRQQLLHDNDDDVFIYVSFSLFDLIFFMFFVFFFCYFSS